MYDYPNRKYWFTLSLLSAAGMAVTGYLIYQHFKPAGGSFCNVSDYVSCDIVNKSKYAEIFGIPVSVLGFAAYTLLFLLIQSVIKQWNLERVSKFLHFRNLLSFLAFFSGFSLAFSLYLTSVEFFFLRAVCIMCVTQQILILIIFIIFLKLWSRHRKSLPS